VFLAPSMIPAHMVINACCPRSSTAAGSAWLPVYRAGDPRPPGHPHIACLKVPGGAAMAGGGAVHSRAQMSESQPIIVRSYRGRPWRERLWTACFGALSAVTRRLQAPPAPTAAYGRILVVKPCCLGDVLMTTPVLAALRQRYPTARIDYAVARHARPAIAGHPEVTALLDAGP